MGKSGGAIEMTQGDSRSKHVTVISVLMGSVNIYRIMVHQDVKDRVRNERYYAELDGKCMHYVRAVS